jgi:uncharacterized RDD family membrane protein YckC
MQINYFEAKPLAMNKNQKKIILVTSLMLALGLMAYVTNAILEHQSELRLAAHNYEGESTVARTFEYIAFILKPFDYRLSGEALLGRALHKLYINADHLHGLVWLLWGLLLLGLILFIAKKDRRVGPLRFVYGIYFFFRLFYLLDYIIYQASLPYKITDDYIMRRDPLWYMALVIAVNLGWAYLSMMMLNELKNYTRLKIKKREEGDAVIEEFDVTPKWQRYIHSLTDGLLMYLLWLTLMQSFIWIITRGERHMDFDDERLILLVTMFGSFFIIRIIYYLIFEGIWGATPGKWLTGSTVRDEKGERVPFRVIAYRTLWRFIPFDNISFFWWRGWHDRFSDTWVCKEEMIDGETDTTVV